MTRTFWINVVGMENSLALQHWWEGWWDLKSVVSRSVPYLQATYKAPELPALTSGSREDCFSNHRKSNGHISIYRINTKKMQYIQFLYCEAFPYALPSTCSHGQYSCSLPTPFSSLQDSRLPCPGGCRAACRAPALPNTNQSTVYTFLHFFCVAAEHNSISTTFSDDYDSDNWMELTRHA